MFVPGAVPDPIQEGDELYQHYADALKEAFAWRDERDKGTARDLADGLESPAVRYKRRFAALFSENVFVPTDVPDGEGGHETWHLKLLSANEIKQVGLSLARVGASLSDIDESVYHETLYAAILYHGVWDLENGPRHFFGDEVEANDFWNTPQFAVVAQHLAHTIVDINPFASAVGEAMGRPEAASLDVLRRLQNLLLTLGT